MARLDPILRGIARGLRLTGLVAAGALASTTAFAQNAGTSTAGVSAVDLEKLRVQLREEITREVRAQVRAEMDQGSKSAEAAPLETDEVAQLGFWEEPVGPELALLELDGYFRFRYDFFAGLDLGTYYKRSGAAQGVGPFVPGFSPPTPLCNTDVRERGGGTNDQGETVAPADSCANREGTDDTLGGANIRFRLEPTLNVYEGVRIRSQIDILDNLVLGSTPDSGYSTLAPLAALSNTQISPSAGVNTLFRDSIRVKRVWGEYTTPLGELSFGRMPNHFGMGITANDGSGIDRDFGDTVDRVMFAAQIGDFVIAPAYDWAASGATSTNLFAQQGQPFDRDQRDDVDQFVLTVSKIDSPEARKLKLANGEVVFDFGTQQMLRFQNLDSSSIPYTDGLGADQDPATTTQIVKRDTQLYKFSYWAELVWEKLTISAEVAGTYGTIGSAGTVGNAGGSSGTSGELFNQYRSITGGESIEISQYGGSLRTSYKLLDDALTLELLVLAASGDGAPGWGVFPLYGSPTQGGAWDGNQAGDGAITNFVFDPDFVVDLIFWRQLVGAVTDAVVIRPSIAYDLTEELGGRLDIIYSRALFAESTASSSFTSDQVGGLDANLGIEADVSLFYRSKHGFFGQFQYGIFIPMDGLDRQVQVEANQQPTATLDQGPVRRLDASVAHTLQVLLGIEF